MRNVLIVGVDIHRKTNTFCLMDESGVEQRPRFSLDNNRPGTRKFVEQVVDVMQNEEFDELRLAAEATGWYWFHFFQTLQQEEVLRAWPVELFALNPRMTANFKKSYGELDKSDVNDAYLIADRLRWGRDLPQPFSFEERYLALRFLTRYRYHVVHQLAREKAYCTSILYLKASEYSRKDRQAFSDLFGAASRAVLEEFASVEEVAALPFEQLVEFIDVHGKRRFPDPATNARQLQRLAQDSYHLPAALQAPIQLILGLSLKQITALEGQLKRIDTAIAEALSSIPHSLDTIPGFGPVFSAGIIAEIGHGEHFNADQNKVADYAGLRWRQSGSADFQAEDTPLTRKGNMYLRYYFCEAAVSMQRRDAEYAAFYKKKYAEASKHRHKRATVLTARKLVRLVVHLLATNQPYQPRKV
ncbi:MAG: IS110 family transposase [Chloroflexi bacterium]|nr:MAG: IS110 family transposase [Chloroflexota bacterium]